VEGEESDAAHRVADEADAGAAGTLGVRLDDDVRLRLGIDR
jgi:hypothetical protein